MSKIDKGLQTPVLNFQRSISSHSGMASSLLTGEMKLLVMSSVTV